MLLTPSPASFAASALLSLLLAAPAGAQRLLVSSDQGGNTLRGFDACTGAADGFAVGGAAAGPRSVRVGPNGNAFLVDETLAGVLEIDPQGRVVRSIVPSGSPQLAQPWALDFDAAGNLLVSSGGAGAARVQRFDGSSGAFLGTLAALPDPFVIRGLLAGPAGRIYASAYPPFFAFGTHTIYEFSASSGALLRRFTGGLNQPEGMAIGTDGLLYVANADGDSIARFDLASGSSLGAFVPARSGGLDGPRDLAIDPRGDLLVTSAWSGGIKRYDGRTGAFLGDFVPSWVQGRSIGIAVQWPLGVFAYGRATRGCPGHPCIGVLGAPTTGNAGFGVRIENLSALQSGVLLLSGAAQIAPLAVQGVELWVDPWHRSFFGFALRSDAAGRAGQALPVPRDPLLAGLRLFAQAVSSDPCGPAGFSATRALEMRILDTGGGGPGCTPPPVLITSPSPVAFSHASYPLQVQHPHLQHVFTTACRETVTVAVSLDALQMASCLSPWMYATLRTTSGFVIAQGTVSTGARHLDLSGSFPVEAQQQVAVLLTLSFNCPSIYVPQAQVPPLGGAATMTVTRTPR